MAIPSNEVASEILDTLLYNRFNFTIPSNPKQKINSIRENKNRTEFFDTYAIFHDTAMEIAHSVEPLHAIRFYKISTSCNLILTTKYGVIFSLHPQRQIRCEKVRHITYCVLFVLLWRSGMPLHRLLLSSPLAVAWRTCRCRGDWVCYGC